MKRFCPLCNNELIEHSKNSFKCKKEIILCNYNTVVHYRGFLLFPKDKKLCETIFLTENTAIHYCDKDNYYISKLLFDGTIYYWKQCGIAPCSIMNDLSKILDKIEMILVFK